ncbi:N-acetyltransferase [Candidatus Sumerlaeota bacterium]|nr:N-acetyltransferase [Candidatus Sumerlaeota bacterium]
MPWRIYRSGPNWVPPLLIEEKERFNPRRNPFYRHARVCLFLARNGREAVGRIAAIVNHAHNRFYNDRVGFFGFFEVVENYEAASLLLDAARQWLAAEGMEVMRGPMNFSTNEECGLLISGYDRPPCIMMPYNPPYYVSFLERYGLAKAKDLLAFHFLTSEFTQRVRKMAAWAEKRSTVRIRPINLADFDEEVERVKQVYNSAWEANWGFVPMSDEELDHMARRLRRVADPNMILFAEDEGRPVGFALTLPDFNQVLIHLNGRLFPFGLIKALWYQRKITCARVILLGILKEYRQHGIDIRFQEKTCEAGVRRGITEAEMSWVLEDNTRMTHGIKYVGGKVYKTYRVYDGKI